MKRKPIYVYIVEHYVEWESSTTIAVFGPKQKDVAIKLADSMQNPTDGRYVSRSEHYSVIRYALNNTRRNNAVVVWPK